MIRGIDVSAYQGRVDWAAVKESGLVQFVYAKATEGLGEVDPEFTRNKEVCAERGIPFGAYHFFHPDEDPRAQAAHFKAVAQPGIRPPLGLKPMVDVEIEVGKSAGEIVASLRLFLTAFSDARQNVLIYTDLGFWNDSVGGSSAFSDRPLWIAEYNEDSEPTLPRGWSQWTLWQHSSSGTVPGIVGDVDLDVLHPRLILNALSV